MATMRSTRVSRAFQTSPMPPDPTTDSSSYGPRRMPARGVVMKGERHVTPPPRLTVTAVLCVRLERVRAQVLQSDGSQKLTGERRSRHVRVLTEVELAAQGLGIAKND